MPSISQLQPLHRRLLRRLNERLAARVHSIVAYQIGGGRMRPRLAADDGMEISGLDRWDIQRSSARIDYGRLRCPLNLFALAALNGQIMAKQFDPIVETDVWLLLDCSPSMLFPLRCVYRQAPIAAELTELELESGKPSLLKRIAGVFMQAGFQNGYRVRVILFGPQGIQEGSALRKSPGHLGVLFQQVDEQFLQAPAPGYSPQPVLGEVINRVARQKGLFLLVSDFMAGAYARMGKTGTAALFTLEKVRQWVQHRPLVVARVNHYEEVRPPPPTRVAGGYMPTIPGDRCDFDVSAASSEELARRRPETVPEGIQRLTAQARWSVILDQSFADARQFLKIHSRTALSHIDVQVAHAWVRLVEV